jgi:protein-L-isoaspartate O-methyltransferase
VLRRLLKPKSITLPEQLERMQRDWDKRARENARYFVDTSRTDWTDETFFASGERNVSEDILTDMTNICQGKDPASMRVLEIGCGAGRLSRALSNIFGEIHAVDVSGEMVARAREALRDRPHVTFYQNNGCDLAVVPAVRFCVLFARFPAHPQPRGYRNLRPRGLPSAPARRAIQVPGAGSSV